MFTIYNSNKLDHLISVFVSLISKQPLENPFEPEIIIAQNNNMNEWFQIKLASQFSIAANFNFFLPSKFIWEMYTRILRNIPDKSLFSKKTMTWYLMHIFSKIRKNSDFSIINNYIRHDIDMLKCFQLADQITRLFKTYLIYRPDWLQSWQKDKLIYGLDENQRWQSALWKVMLTEKKQIGEHLWKLANLYNQFIQTLGKTPNRQKILPKRIFIYGISAIPPLYFQVFEALSKHIDIHLFLTNPRQFYRNGKEKSNFAVHFIESCFCYNNQKIKLDLFQKPKIFENQKTQKIDNPLFSSWGKQREDNLHFLSQIQDLVEINAFVEPKKNNLLSLLQHDIFMLEDHSTTEKDPRIGKHKNKKRILQLDDRSLTLHACHNPHREIEVLYDNLVEMLSVDSTLHPQDIIVMMPDIHQYKPAIQAVFGDIDGEHCLPFNVIDYRMHNLPSILVAFLNILELPQSRCSSEQILGLLEIPALAARFSINKLELQLLRKWIAESGVRWGLDDDTFHQFMLPVSKQNTWHFGLTRMLLGYAMNSKHHSWQDIVPYDVSSGLIAAIIGNLSELLMRLRQWRDKLTPPRLINNWLNCPQEIIADFFMPDVKEKDTLILFENHWKQLIEGGFHIGYAELVPVTLLKHKVTISLQNEQLHQSLLPRRINFCRIMPIQHIPFRVVCLLGMNEGAYPRTNLPQGFDLMVKNSRRGDPDQRNDDCYLFLEALTFAQERFYISFIENDMRDNTLHYPSVLVNELIDYIAQSFYLKDSTLTDTNRIAEQVRTHLLEKHSRMSFLPELFFSQNNHQRYSQKSLITSNKKSKPKENFITPLKSHPNDALSLEDLMSFYRHPVRTWFMKGLRVSFYKKSLQIATNEPFVVDNLTRFQLNNQLINSLVDKKNSNMLFNKIRGSGILPYGPFGELYWTKQCENMEMIANQVRSLRLGETFNLEINLSLGKIMFFGRLSQVQKNGILRWRPTILSACDGLSLWIEHLTYCAMGGKGESRMFGINSKWHFGAISSDQAKNFLLLLTSGYYQGMKRPLLLLFRSGEAWLKHCYNKTTKRIDYLDESRQKKAHNMLLKAWMGTLYTFGENKDPYLRRLMPQLNAQHIEEIILASERYLLPLFVFNLSKTTMIKNN
ncbi:DNA helicase/exodeoxyribonuclease V, gamma subunit [secondary endosymbiont of Heteropsylla cubana]|uniref:RecBCD enzyme subunit RecC n=1 Tax=secondary endosymbiont of Heteropsylla cubana TaxID=134287 RepID=J3YTE5_9ENTR|nr:exodeoxyribonuclease V subunit gamma [secondary endosymbiont of Heteropsylla cubana]AFP85723.1 DNA helicase/exodeoxyribonuclease V, gamma subunit [secondary endosymbiont of Heteropsylla cubana]